MKKSDLDIIAFHWVPMAFILGFLILPNLSPGDSGAYLIPLSFLMLGVFPAVLYCMIRVWRREVESSVRFLWGLVVLCGPVGQPIYYWIRIRKNPDYPGE
jgi:hypothetical protein